MSRRASLLLGWGNATPAQLRAYERLHEATGLAPTSVIPSTAQGLLAPSAYARAVDPVADAMLEGRAVEVVHVFSDNGFLGWAALLERLGREGARGRDALARVRGVLVDSAPGLWASTGVVDFARRFSQAMTPLVARALGRDPGTPLPAVGHALTGVFVGFQLARPSVAARMKRGADRVFAHQPRVPHLVLYAREDALVPARDVEAWIARQRALGVDVTARCFARARHVALYPADPRRYRDEVAAFVRRVTTAEEVSLG